MTATRGAPVPDKPLLIGNNVLSVLTLQHMTMLFDAELILAETCYYSYIVNAPMDVFNASMDKC